MLLCGGIAGDAQAFQECWVAELQELRWEQLVVDAIPRSPASGFPSLPKGQCAAAWSEMWDGVLVWGGHICGLWQESDEALEKRLKRLRHNDEAAQCAKKNEQQDERRRQKLARQQGKLEDRRAAEAAEKDRREQEKADLEAWRRRQESQRREEEKIRLEAEAKEVAERERQKLLRRGGGFNLELAATLQVDPLLAAGVAVSQVVAPPARTAAAVSGRLTAVRPNFVGWGQNADPGANTDSRTAGNSTPPKASKPVEPARLPCHSPPPQAQSAARGGGSHVRQVSSPAEQKIAAGGGSRMRQTSTPADLRKSQSSSSFAAAGREQLLAGRQQALANRQQAHVRKR